MMPYLVEDQPDMAYADSGLGQPSGKGSAANWRWQNLTWPYPAGQEARQAWSMKKWPNTGSAGDHGENHDWLHKHFRKYLREGLDKKYHNASWVKEADKRAWEVSMSGFGPAIIAKYPRGSSWATRDWGEKIWRRLPVWRSALIIRFSMIRGKNAQGKGRGGGDWGTRARYTDREITWAWKTVMEATRNGVRARAKAEDAKKRQKGYGDALKLFEPALARYIKTMLEADYKVALKIAEEIRSKYKRPEPFARLLAAKGKKKSKDIAALYAAFRVLLATFRSSPTPANYGKALVPANKLAEVYKDPRAREELEAAKKQAADELETAAERKKLQEQYAKEKAAAGANRQAEILEERRQEQHGRNVAEQRRQTALLRMRQEQQYQRGAGPRLPRFDMAKLIVPAAIVGGGLILLMVFRK